MHASSIHVLLHENISLDKVESILHRAALEAFQDGWTYMEASFQLGGRASDLGLETSRVEHVLRSAFDIERRKEVREDSPTEQKGGVPVTGAYLHPSEQVHYLKRKSSRLLNVEAVSIPWPADDWRLDLKKLLKSCFTPEESFAINRSRAGRSSVQKVTDALKPDDEFIKTIRSLDGESGAWLRVNPTMGDRESDLLAYRYVLVENTTLEIGKQLAFYRALNLPAAALINTGGKSIQAWIKIEATNLETFEKRVRYLTDTLKSSGFEVNFFEGDPLALSALPGILVDGKQHYLISLQEGANSWDEWNSWAEAYLDGSPLIEEAKMYTEAPMHNLELITGVFRQSHRMLISGESGIGKSLLSIDLALSLAQGEPFLGLETEKSHVLYVNLEVDPTHLVNRFFEVQKAKGFSQDFSNIDYLHLMGVEKNIAELGDLLVKRLKAAAQWEGKEYHTIVVDGVGKIPGSQKRIVTGTGDSISMELCLDKVVAQTGAAVVILLKENEMLKQNLNVDTHLKLVSNGNKIDFDFKSRHYPDLKISSKVLDYPCFK